MTDTSIICVRQDVESVLKALSNFGEFHIEQNIENKTVAEYNVRIQKTEESLSNINELMKQLNREKTGLFDIFKAAEPIKIEVTADNWESLSNSTNEQVAALKKQVDDVNTSLTGLQEKTGQLNRVKEMLEIMEKMKADLGAVEDLKLVHSVIASIPHKNLDGLRTALAEYPLILQSCYETKESAFVCSVVPSKLGSDLDKALRLHHAEIFSVPRDLPHDAKQALGEVNNRLKETSERTKQLNEAVEVISRENMSKLTCWKETTDNVLVLLNAKKKILESGRLATIEGFVPQQKFPELSAKVHEMLGDKAIVLRKETEESADPPTNLSNSRFVKPFEEITKLYGLPHYNELDPTPFMAISFPILFGLMFGDMGHGLILFVAGLSMFFLVKKNQSIKNMCWILATCGLAAIIAGALFGEFFGQEIFHPLWFSPVHNVFDFLIFALYIGVFQILLGLALEMADFLLNHDIADAVFLSIPRMSFYIGSVYVITVYGLDLAAWFAGPVLLIIVPFILMVVAKPAYIAVANLSSMKSFEGERELTEEAEEEKESPFAQSLFESGDTLTRLLSNSISYSRILALLMAHWALLLVVYTVAGLVGGVAGIGILLAGIIIVVGNLGVIALEGLIVFIHDLRLHFYEWFSKFYKGTGTEFHPYKQNSVYTDVHLQSNNKTA